MEDSRFPSRGVNTQSLEGKELPKYGRMKKRKKFHKNRYVVTVTIAILIVTIGGLGLGRLVRLLPNMESSLCESYMFLSFTDDSSLSLNTSKDDTSLNCYKFQASQGQILTVYTTAKATIENPDKQTSSFQGNLQIPVLVTGEYALRVEASNDNFLKIAFQPLDNKSIATTQSLLKNSNSSAKSNFQTKIAYNVKEPPLFFSDRRGKLQQITNEAIELVRKKGLPIDKFSISLIDLEEPCCAYVGYQDELPRFPASITKLFWMVAIFARYQGTDVTPVRDKVYKMIQNSDNNPASSILDELTGTDSGKPLPSGTIEAWVAKRKSVNKIFTDAGYPDLNISQKNFPIPDLDLREPEGRDMQMRGDPKFPERNYLTTYSVARLLLEIGQGKAVSSLSSEKMKSLLKRDYTREKNREYDAIKGFLGEGLDPEIVQLYSKAGWTNKSRQDAAIIVSRDSKTRYILVVFGNDASFAKDETVFPDIAKMVYAKMRL